MYSCSNDKLWYSCDLFKGFWLLRDIWRSKVFIRLNAFGKCASLGCVRLWDVCVLNILGGILLECCSDCLLSYIFTQSVILFPTVGVDFSENMCWNLSFYFNIIILIIYAVCKIWRSHAGGLVHVSDWLYVANIASFMWTRLRLDWESSG